MAGNQHLGGDHMKIKLKLFASFRIGRFKEQICEYPEGVIVKEIVQQLGIEKESLGIILLNGQHANDSKALHEGDVLSLIPLIGGG